LRVKNQRRIHLIPVDGKKTRFGAHTDLTIAVDNICEVRTRNLNEFCVRRVSR